MSSRNSEQAIAQTQQHRPGTEAMFKWAKWQRQNNFPRTTAVLTFVKNERRLVVFSYGSFCGVLSLSAKQPRVQKFNPWSQPLKVVSEKLTLRGWRQVESAEVCHAH